MIFSEGLCKIAEQYLHKGSKVMLRGQLQTRKWTNQQGQDQYSTEIVLQGFDAKLILLDGKNSGQGQASAGQQGSGGYGGVNNTGQGNTSGSGAGGFGGAAATSGGGHFDKDLDDEIPF